MQTLFPYNVPIFQDAPVNSAKVIEAWFRKHQDEVKCISWPPDLHILKPSWRCLGFKLINTSSYVINQKNRWKNQCPIKEFKACLTDSRKKMKTITHNSTWSYRVFILYSVSVILSTVLMIEKFLSALSLNCFSQRIHQFL